MTTKSMGTLPQSERFSLKRLAAVVMVFTAIHGTSQVQASHGANLDVEAFFADNTIIDGNMSMLYRTSGLPDTLTDITADTGVNITSQNITRSSQPTPQKMAEWIETRLTGNETRRNSFQHILTSNDIDLALRNGKYGALFYIQNPWDVSGGASVEDEVQSWFDNGLRVVQLAYNSDTNNTDFVESYAGGADEDVVGLSKAGEDVVDALLAKYMVVDVSHVGKASVMRIVEKAKVLGRPILANHANAEGVYLDTLKSRNKDDEEICAIVSTGGVVGVTPIRFMLADRVGGTNLPATTEDLIDHIEYIRTLDCTPHEGVDFEMINHMSVATDQGPDGADPTNTWLYVDSRMGAEDRWKTLAQLLHDDYNYTEDELRKLFGGNLLRLYRETLPGLREFSLLAPAEGAAISNSNAESLILSWEVSQAQGQNIGEPSYDVFIYQNQGGAWERVRAAYNRTTTSVTVSNLAENAQYRWYVHADNGEEWINSGWGYFSTTETLPPTVRPIGLRPGDVVSDRNVAFQWTPSNGDPFTRYDLHIYRFINGGYERYCTLRNLSNVSQVVRRLDANRQHRWFVRAHNESGAINSGWGFFRTLGVPSGPIPRFSCMN